MPKKDAKARTRASGLSAKLSAYFLATKRERRRDPDQPANARQLAFWITAHGAARGDTVEDTTVRQWENGVAMPEARYVGYLEQILGAPWWWIDLTSRPWPPTADDRELFGLVLTAGADERRRVLERFSRGGAEASRRAPRA